MHRSPEKPRSGGGDLSETGKQAAQGDQSYQTKPHAPERTAVLLQCTLGSDPTPLLPQYVSR